MLQASGISKYYGKFLAVDDLSFAVQPGEVLGLVGPNGAGKTSTLRCLAGIIPPTKGTVDIDGVPLLEKPIEAKRRLHFFPDEPRLFDHLTVRQHLAFYARLYRVEGYEATGDGLLAEFELDDKRDKLPGELSRGMKQKLAIACGFLHEPRVMIIDEPLTGLDPYGIRTMKDAILARAARGASIVLSSHLLHLLEEVCSHVLILKSGRKIYDGTLAGVLARFGGGDIGTVSLEKVFFLATSDEPVAPQAPTLPPPPEAPPAATPPPVPPDAPPPLPPPVETPPPPLPAETQNPPR